MNKKASADHIVVDSGNSDIKSYAFGGIEDILAHDVKFMRDNEYEALVKKARERPIEFQDLMVFKKIYKDGTVIPVVIGDGASKSGMSNKETGVGRFRAGYYDTLIAAVLMRHLPVGSDNVRLAIGVPVNSTMYYDDIRAILVGTHKVQKLDGKEIKYRVTDVKFWEEPEGSILRYFALHDERRAEYQASIRKPPAQRPIAPLDFSSGSRVIVADFGGQVSSLTMTRLNRRGSVEILYSETPEPFPMGILNVKKDFATELMTHHRNEFKPFKTPSGIPSHMLEEGLRNGVVIINGTQQLRVTEARQAAVGGFMQGVHQIYNDQMAGGVTALAIALTGGGSTLLLPMLRLDVFNRDNVELVGDSATIQFENMRGAAIAYEVYMQENGLI